jgi:hypothetical protein
MQQATGLQRGATIRIATGGTVANVISFKPAVQPLSTKLMYRFDRH